MLYVCDCLTSYIEIHMYTLGVKGIVTDENNNKLAGAQLTIQGREFVPFHTRPNGEYFRILMPGEYTIQV